MTWGRWILLGIVLAGLGYWSYLWFATAALDVTSEPAGAEVRVDGQRLGLTPFHSEPLAPGVHRVEVQHSHYRKFERRMSLSAGGRTPLHVQLEPGVGRLLLHSNPRGAWVEVDGERREGRTPLILELPSGAHEIAAGMDERHSASQRVLVVADEQREVLLDLDMDPHGNLQVDTRPASARVTLPGLDVDYEDDVRLPVGEYLLQISHPGFITQRVRFRVRYGTNRYQVTLERAYGLLTVTTRPPDARVRVDHRGPDGGRMVRRDYEAGMRLPTGTVEVRARAMGRRSAYRRIDLGAEGAHVELALTPVDVRAGSRFRDDLRAGGQGPEMVVVPPGRFLMGDADGAASERPVREVAITEPFAVSVHEVSMADYRRFAGATGQPLAEELADRVDQLPVTHVTFAEAVAYADWLTAETGRRYRLLSEAEWEYMARAGTTTAYSFGDAAADLCRHANLADQARQSRYAGFDVAECSDGFVALAPVGSLAANGFGIHDVHGNVAEWVLDCGMPEYAGAPDDGSPAAQGTRCVTHGVRGGAWDSGVAEVRSAKRNLASSANGSRGIRLLREL